MNNIRSMTKPELIEYLTGIGEAKYRADQLFNWFHSRCIESADAMTNIPKSIKNGIGDLEIPIIKEVQKSADGTRKYLFEMHDGALVESVLMKYKYGNSVCISSQVGCRMGCKFCASTLDGLDRNLEPAEMLDQIYMISHDIDERVSHVVVMGTGEPMDNFDNLIRFLELITDPDGYNLSRRNITVSTCGIADKIREFADKNTGVTLALSLHAPFDELRRSIMPVTNRYSIEEVVEAARYYFDVTGRRVTLEYALARGVNDSDECVDGLADICMSLAAHVNLIPVNPVTERGYDPTSPARVLEFKNKLEKKGINVTIRRELGQDIDGACGQLRRRHNKAD